jgi:hypothetical protein
MPRRKPEKGWQSHRDCPALLCGGKFLEGAWTLTRRSHTWRRKAQQFQSEKNSQVL